MTKPLDFFGGEPVEIRCATAEELLLQVTEAGALFRAYDEVRK